jgi:hypothetical protein
VEVKFKTKIVGVSFGDRQETIHSLMVGERLTWRHDVGNVFDKNAIAICDSHNRMIGHLSRKQAEEFVKRIEDGKKQDIFVEKITGQEDSKFKGVNIQIDVL